MSLRETVADEIRAEQASRQDAERADLETRHVAEMSALEAQMGALVEERVHQKVSQMEAEVTAEQEALAAKREALAQAIAEISPAQG